MSIFSRCLLSTLAAAFAVAVTGCSAADADIGGLTIDPNTASKGDTLRIEGQVSSLDSLTEISFTVTDDAGTTPPGISVQSVALASNKTSWDLKNDGDTKLVTTTDAPSGTYHLKVEAKTSKKTNDDQVDFTVH